MFRGEIIDAVKGYDDKSVLELSAILRRGFDADTVRAVRILSGYVPDLRQKITFAGRDVWEPFTRIIFDAVVYSFVYSVGVADEDVDRERAAALRDVNEGAGDDFVSFCIVSRFCDSVEHAARMVARGEYRKGAKR